MNIQAVMQALIPWAGAGARFRFYLRLREFYRKHHMHFLASCLKSHLQYKYGCEIAVNAAISSKASFMHTVGIVIGEGVIVESGVTIYSNVCLGRKNICDEDDYPTVKRGALLSTGCSVLGKVIVEENAVIGAHSLVLSDCIRDGVYVGVPARIIGVHKQ